VRKCMRAIVDQFQGSEADVAAVSLDATITPTSAGIEVIGKSGGTGVRHRNVRTKSECKFSAGRPAFSTKWTRFQG
jgi:hypothetical protein